MAMTKEEFDVFFQELLKKEASSISYSIENVAAGHYTKNYGTWKRAQNITRCFQEELRGKEAGVKVLDIGCANGFFIFLLNSIWELLKETQFYGVDISAFEINLAKELAKHLNVKNVIFEVGDAQDLKLPSLFFDIAICAEVIEHTISPDKVLSEIRRILKPKGLAIITTPNKTNSLLKFKNLFYFSIRGKKPNSSKKNEDRFESYQRHVSVKGLREWIKIIEHSGFRIEGVRRGSLLCGGGKYDAHPFLFAISLILDRILDYLPFAANFTEDITFKLRKPC